MLHPIGLVGLPISRMQRIQKYIVKCIFLVAPQCTLMYDRRIGSRGHNPRCDERAHLCVGIALPEKVGLNQAGGIDHPETTITGGQRPMDCLQQSLRRGYSHPAISTTNGYGRSHKLCTSWRTTFRGERRPPRPLGLQVSTGHVDLGAWSAKKHTVHRVYGVVSLLLFWILHTQLITRHRQPMKR